MRELVNVKVAECSKCGLYLNVIWCNIDRCHGKFCQTCFPKHVEDHRVDARIKNEGH